jgi:hypothetical protein
MLVRVNIEGPDLMFHEPFEVHRTCPLLFRLASGGALVLLDPPVISLVRSCGAFCRAAP